MEGKVKWYNVKKGYGFIAGDDGNEYFVHFTGLVKGTKLYADDVVTFEAVDTEKGLQAQQVSKPEGSDDSQSTASEESDAPVQKDERSSGENEEKPDSDVSGEGESEPESETPKFEDEGATDPGVPEEETISEEESDPDTSEDAEEKGKDIDKD